jgi:uncharacterized protein (UPF0335 family)
MSKAQNANPIQRPEAMALIEKIRAVEAEAASLEAEVKKAKEGAEAK